MAVQSKKLVLGKRARCSSESKHAEPSRVSKRLREKREASAGRATIRNGLTTPESSSLTESPPSPPAHDAELALRDIFPFMQLPAELRIHIYHMALHRDTPLYLHAENIAELEAGETSTIIDSDSHLTSTDLSARARRPRPSFTPLDIAPLHDPISPTILRLNQQIYKEARSVLYSGNTFILSLVGGIYTLSTLHQRSRSLIKHVILSIPSHHDILDGFADLVRLGLRYCWGLKTFKIILQASLPDDGRMTHATSVYANAFHILRWLPRGCKVVLEGNVSEVVKDVVREEGRLQSVLDEVGYAKRQHQMPERH